MNTHNNSGIMWEVLTALLLTPHAICPLAPIMRSWTCRDIWVSYSVVMMQVGCQLVWKSKYLSDSAFHLPIYLTLLKSLLPAKSTKEASDGLCDGMDPPQRCQYSRSRA
ncbi:hypothetical protein SLA2020_273670 [Shorea laevis]